MTAPSTTEALTEARGRIAGLEADLRAAVLEIGVQARARGEAEGALRASEMAGVVDGWRGRALTAEASLAARIAGDQAGYPAVPVVEDEPVATVLWYDPEAHFGEKKPHKIIDASMAFMDTAEIGTKLYARPSSFPATTPGVPESWRALNEAALAETIQQCWDSLTGKVKRKDTIGWERHELCREFAKAILAAHPAGQSTRQGASSLHGRNARATLDEGDFPKPAPDSPLRGPVGVVELRGLISEAADAVFAIDRPTLSEQQVDRAYTAAERLLDYRDRNLPAACPAAPPSSLSSQEP